MKHCIKCGAAIDTEAKFCNFCGQNQSSEEPTESYINNIQSAPEQDVAPPEKLPKRILNAVLDFVRRFYKIIIIVAVVVGIIIAATAIYNATHCSYGSCNNSNVEGSDYCYEHKCSICNEMRSSSSSKNYCYYHYVFNEYKSSTSTNTNASSPSYDLRFTNIKIEHNSLYTVVTGTVTNKGSTTYRFVTIKGAFKNSSGTVVDTDSTYAVGSEGLAPGESTTFRMSVDKNYNIKNCSISIIDYD